MVKKWGAQTTTEYLDALTKLPALLNPASQFLPPAWTDEFRSDTEREAGDGVIALDDQTAKLSHRRKQEATIVSEEKHIKVLYSGFDASRDQMSA